MRAALSSAGVEVAPVVLHQRKAFSARMQEGRTAAEIEPKGKAAEEIRALFLWICKKVDMLQSE
jgi:chromosome partitioning protein